MRARSGPTTVLLLLLPSLRLSFAAQLPVYDCRKQLKCLALLVGNSKYRPGDADPKALTSPFYDVVDMAKLLQDSGATVTVKHDLTYEQMQGETVRFQGHLRAARKDSGGTQGAIGIFYYSGHGIGSDGETYLLPVDLGELLVGKDQTVKNTQDIGVKVSSIAKQMESAGTAQSIIILDSCRTRLSGDPVVKGSADGHPSYAKPVDLPHGTRTVIAFAAKAGNVALQNMGDRKHSVYTHHFLEAAKSSGGLPIGQLLEKVASFVTKATRQDGAMHMTPELVVTSALEFSRYSFALIPSSSSDERPSSDSDERPSFNTDESGHDETAAPIWTVVLNGLKMCLFGLVIFAAGAGTMRAFTGRDEKKMSTQKPADTRKRSGVKALPNNQQAVYYHAKAGGSSYTQALKKAEAAKDDGEANVELTKEYIKDLKRKARQPHRKHVD